MVAESETISGNCSIETTLFKLLADWLAHSEMSFSPKTAVTVRGYVERTIAPAIGHIPIAKLTPADLDAFYRQLIEKGGAKVPFKPATVRRCHGIIRSALAQAVRWGWIKHNPAIDATPPKVHSPEINPPTPKQVAAIYKAALEDNRAFAAYIVLAAASGARRSEMVALRWRNIDLDNHRLVIQRGVVGVAKGLVEKDTKTHQVRKLTLDRNTVVVLREHLKRCEEIAAASGTSIGPDSQVFSGEPDGSIPWWPDSVTRAFRVLSNRAGVKGIRLHDLRQYIATRLLSEGIDVRTVAGRLGHRNAITTLDVYSHFIPESDSEAAEALGRLFEEAVEGE